MRDQFPLHDPLDPSSDTADLLALDRQHVWHPYGPMPGRLETLVVASASGGRQRRAAPAPGRAVAVVGCPSVVWA
ncbi:hypothetical protein ACFVHW_12320, partial [Streptomyces sp. NPDC127110]